MADLSNIAHTASGQALGYFFQARYSLLLLLQVGREDPDAAISVEKFDDVSFDKNASPIEQIQLKHSIQTTKSLSDRSSDLWKTLSIWIAQYNASPEKNVNYTLVTTAQASDTSIACLLRPSQEARDIDSIHEKLAEIALGTQSETNKDYYKAFLALEEDARKDLLSNIFILDSSPNICDTKKEILKIISYATHIDYQEQLFNRLEGWWFDKVVTHLSEESYSPLTGYDLRLELNSLQEQLLKDNLPIDFLDYEPTQEEISNKDKVFIHQLKLIAAHNNKIRFAIQDYYRAFHQRSRWLRENLVSPDDLQKYEKRLLEEWQRLFTDMQEDIDANQSEDDLKRAGKALYKELDKLDRESMYIRPKCKEPYVTRGSYQILSDQLKVGWHKDFYDRLKHLASDARETLA